MSSRIETVRVLVTTFDPIQPRMAGDELYSGSLHDAMTKAVGDQAFVVVVLRRADLTRRPFLAVLAMFLPIMWLRYFTLENFRNVRQAVNRPGTTEVWTDHFRTGWIQLLVGRTVRMVHVSHNCEYEICRIAAHEYASYKRIVFLFEGLKVRFWERRLVRRSLSTSCITREDVVLFQSHYGMSSYHVLAPDYSKPMLEYRTTEDIPFTAIIIGSYAWGLKRHNLRAYLASITTHSIPKGFNLLVAGMIPPDFAHQLTSDFPWVTIRSNFDSLVELQGLGKIGLCIDSVGGGFKMKTLDYMNLGLPILGLTVALSGVPESSGILRFQSYEEMNKRLFELAEHQDLCREMGRTNLEILKSTFASGHFDRIITTLLHA